MKRELSQTAAQGKGGTVWRVCRVGENQVCVYHPREPLLLSAGPGGQGVDGYKTASNRLHREIQPEFVMPATDAPVDKSETRVRDMFRQVAPRYDAMNHLLSLNIDRYWRSCAAKSLKLVDQSPVLDVCTGTGDLALAIRKRAGVPVIGSDFCGAMLRIARQKQSRIGDAEQQPVAFVEADSQRLPFPDDTFQAVTVAFGLRNVADTDRGLAEMTRVCKPDGQVMILEFSNPTTPGFSQIYRLYFEHVLPRIGQMFARNDKDAYRYLQKSVGQFPQGQQLADRMLAAGLVQTRFRPLTFGVATIYTGMKPSAGTTP
jgi:demethylmenaquinone methyltransferase / 2-methoxy-6-polyprenyl-1,4-benzoquinol methylase